MSLGSVHAVNNANDIQNDLLAGIHKELRGHDSDVSTRNSPKTVKYHLAGIHRHLTKLSILNDREAGREQSSMRMALGIVAFLGLVLLTNSIEPNPDFTFINPYLLVLSVCGVVLALVFICGVLERSPFWKSIWSLTSARWIVYIIFTAMVLVASGKAASQVNAVFGVDAASFPRTYAFTTALVLFKLAKPWLIGIAIVALIVSFCAVRRGLKAVVEKYEIWALFMPVMTIILGAFVIFRVGGWDNNELSNERLDQKIFLMAQVLDLNTKHNCKGIPSTHSVIFLGPTQERVLVAPPPVPDLDFTTFFHADIEVPDRFVQVDCRTGDVPSNWSY